MILRMTYFPVEFKNTTGILSYLMLRKPLFVAQWGTFSGLQQQGKRAEIQQKNVLRMPIAWQIYRKITCIWCKKYIFY